VSSSTPSSGSSDPRRFLGERARNFLDAVIGLGIVVLAAVFTMGALP
jgi:hypothetical protein